MKLCVHDRCESAFTVMRILRVVLNNKDRYAAIFFKLVNDDTVLDPFKKFCEKEPAKYKPETYKKFGLDKMNALYGKE